MAGEKIKGGITTSSLVSLKQGDNNASMLSSGNSITNLQQTDKLLKMEKKVLEAKESYVDANLAKLFEDTFKSLQAWKTQLQNREKGLIEKADRVNNFIRRTREVYGYNDPNIGVCDGGKATVKGNFSSSEGTESSGDGAFAQSTPEDEEEEENDEGEKKNRKVKIMDNKKMKTMKDHMRRRNIERMKKDEEDDAVLLREMNGEIRHGTHLHTDADTYGWTIPKIQRLYLRYCRAESFRKALAYQKRYLTLTSPPRRPKTLGDHRKWSLKSIACVVVAVIRMKFLVGRYHQRIEICSTVKRRKNPMIRKTNKLVAHAFKASSGDEENVSDGSYLATNRLGKTSPRHKPLATCDPNTPTKDSSEYTSSTTDSSSGCHSDEVPVATKINQSYPRIPGTGKTDTNQVNDTVWNFHWKPISPKTYAPDSMTVSYPRCIAKKDVSESPGFRSNLQKEEKFLGDAELSLSSYMKTLEDLQTKLKLISS